MYIKNNHKKIIYISSTTIGILFLLYIFISGLYYPTPPYIIPLDKKVTNLFVISLLLIIFLPALVEYNNSKWIKNVEENIPLFLKDLNESVKSGLTITLAMEKASSRNFGPITRYLEKTMERYNFTSKFNESMDWFSEKLVSSKAQRMCGILKEAHYTGSQVSEIIESSLEIFTRQIEFKKERRNETNPYKLVSYIGMFVFLSIAQVLITKFFSPIELGEQLTLVGVNQISDNLDTRFFTAIFYCASIIEAVVGGLFIGKITDGKIKSGMIHSVLLLIVTYLFFNILI